MDVEKDSPKNWISDPPVDADTIIGASTADEIHLAVGRALTAWEEAEDAQTTLFSTLIRTGDDPVPDVAHEAASFGYFKASRSARNDQLKAVLDLYLNGRADVPLSAEMRASIIKTVGVLDQLAKLRNQITHGRCTSHGFVRDGRVVRVGFFLIPPNGEWQHTSARNQDFAHTRADILALAEASTLRAQVFLQARLYISCYRAKRVPWRFEQLKAGILVRPDAPPFAQSDEFWNARLAES